MKLIHRIGYYLGGFSIGLILLAFFLGGKKASCAYGPNARTIKNISLKKHEYSDSVKSIMRTYELDSLDISEFIESGQVNFSKSDTKSEDCKTYLIENEYNEKQIELTVKNCDSVASLESLIIK